MFRRFILPFIVSFVALDLLGGLILTPLSILFQLVVPSSASNPLVTFVLGYVIAYVMVIAVGILRYRRDSLRLIAIIVGPIILFPLQCVVLTLVVMRVLSLSGI